MEKSLYRLSIIFYSVIFSFLLGILNLTFSFDSSNLTISDLSYSVEDGKIVFTWSPLTGSENLEIRLFNFNSKTYDTLGTTSVNNLSYSLMLNCDLVSSNSKNGEMFFSFIPRNLTRGELTYLVNINVDDYNCFSGNSESQNLNSTSSSSKEKSSSNTFIMNTNSKIKSIKGTWYYEGDQQALLDNGFTREKYNAYKFAYNYGLTSAKNIESANMEGQITRAALAKIIANFAKNILKLKPDSTKKCSFLDVTPALDYQYDNGITEVCQLGIMGVGIPNFRPYESVYRSEFGSVLSRLIFGLNDGTNGIPYFEPHLNLLRNRGILSNTDPYKVEKRGNILLMLMRTAINIIIEIPDEKKANYDSDDAALERSEWLVLLEIVEMIDPSFVREARNILTDQLTDVVIKNSDLSLPNVCYSIESGNNIKIYWNYMPYSKYVDVRVWDAENSYFYTIGTVPMGDEYFYHHFDNPNKRTYFSLIPKDVQGSEYTFDVDFKTLENTCTVKKIDSTPEIISLREKLGKASYVLERLVYRIDDKNETAIKNAKRTLRNFKSSDDEFTNDIGTYLLLLLD